MGNFFKLLSAGPAFFLSAWLLMVFGGIVGEQVGTRPFGYPTATAVSSPKRRVRPSVRTARLLMARQSTVTEGLRQQ